MDFEQHLPPNITMLEPNLPKKFLLNDFSASHLSTILANINSPDPMVANTWLETLLDILKVLPQESILSKILPFSIAKGQASQSLQSKLAAIKILSNICHFLEDDQLLKDVLPLVRSLSQDEETDVRVAVCSLFNLIYVKLDSQFLSSGYYNLLVELFHDRSLVVRDAVFAVCAEMISLFYNEDFIKNIFLKCKDHVQGAVESEPKLLPLVAKNLCVLASINEDVPVISDKIWFVDCYIKIIHLTDENIIRSSSLSPTSEPVPEDDHDLHNLYLQCRINLASSFDFMAKLCTSLNRSDMLCPFLDNFTLDSYSVVRLKIAEKLGLIATYFKDSSSSILKVLNKLLKDSSIEVIKSLVPQIADVLYVLHEAKLIGHPNDSNSAEELCRSLIQCESKIFNESLSWQLYESLLEQYSSFPQFFSSSVIYNIFCKLFFERMTLCRALPSRLACTKILLVFLRHNSNPNQCNEIRRQIIDLSYSDNFYERMLYVKTCSTILDLFSSSYFETYFLPSIFRLASDKVANIRLAIVFLLPRVITVLQLNNSPFNALEIALAKLREDHDPEIQYQMELLDSTNYEPLPPSLIQANEEKFQEEAVFGKKEDPEPVVTSNFSFSDEPKKNRWSVLTRNRDMHINVPKMTTVISANRYLIGDTEMEFMIDAGVSFSKTISSRIPSICHKPAAELYDYPHLFPNCSHIPVYSTTISPSYQMSPLVFHVSNQNVELPDVDGMDHFHKAFARRKHLIPEYFDPELEYSRVQVRPGPPLAEKVTGKSGSNIPKSKAFRVSNNTSLYGSSDGTASRGKSFSGSTSNKNGNSNRDSHFVPGKHFFSKSKPKTQPLMLPMKIPGFYHSGPQSYSQDSNLNPLPRPRTYLDEPPPENVNKQKKYSSRLPVRSTKRDNRNSSQ